MEFEPEYTLERGRAVTRLLGCHHRILLGAEPLETSLKLDFCNKSAWMYWH